MTGSAGRGNDRDDQRPVVRQAVLPAPHKDANPNDGSTYDLGDNYSPNPIDERQVVDNSFLGLVLFGAKKWNDPMILNSLAVGDRELRVDTPNGLVWHRFSRRHGTETAATGTSSRPPPTRRTGAYGRSDRRARRVRAARRPARGRLPGDDGRPPTTG
jgi:hypothetical protein